MECKAQGEPGGGEQGRGRGRPELGGTRVREGLGLGKGGQVSGCGWAWGAWARGEARYGIKKWTQHQSRGKVNKVRRAAPSFISMIT